MIKNNNSGYFPDALQSALIASFPMLVLLVVTPAQIYAGNQPYFNHRVGVVLDLSLVYAAVLLLLYLLFRTVPWLRKPAGYPLAIVGMLIFGVSVFSPLPIAAIDRGRIEDIEIFPVWAMFDVGTLVALWVLVRYVPEKTLVRIGSVFCGLLVVAAPAGVAFEALKEENSVAAWTREHIAGPEKVQDSPNVYHFIFDGFEGTLFWRIVSELDLTRSFSGFIWYSDSYSNYVSTRLSIPSSMIGRLFEETIDDNVAIEMARTGGIVKTLASHGYSTTQYNAFHINNHELANERYSTALIEEKAYGGLRYMVQLLDLSLLRSAPHVLKDNTAVDGRGLIGHAFLRNKRSIADWSRNPPLLSLMLLSQLVEDERMRPGRGQYVNGHFLIPHSPMVMSASCDYQPARGPTRVNLVEQSMCTIKKLAEFLQILRELGRFEDAIIMVHSDHGTLQRDRPLLLAKYSGRSMEPLAVADYPVQLIDIVPTILDELGIAHSELDGVSLKNGNPGARKEIKVWLTGPPKS